ncbi:MAG: TetR/AcrR family transcriptional regulator [Variovorax sp.]|nr:MAG: TetR/AcrR family transcriptional regulator [Variovorax sp.]
MQPSKQRKPAHPDPPAARPLGAAAQATRDGILRAATKVFAKHGFAGASVEKISKAARSVDRMIYYYFGSKEGLFVAVLEDMYRRMDEAEAAIEFDLSQPREALMEVIRFVHRYYRRRPDFVTLINTENLHHGEHIAKSKRAHEYSSRALGIIASILEEGVAQGLYRPGVRPRDIYLLITSTGYFPTSNQHTLRAFLGDNLATDDSMTHWEEFVIDTVLRLVSSGRRPSGR